MKERIDITLTGDDATWFEETREEIASDRNGNKPTRPEALRRIMEDSDLA